MKDSLISVFKDLYKSKDVPFIITLEKSLERIKIGKSKGLIDFANDADSKNEYDRRKSKLPCIIFSGKFKERSKKGLESHSGLMVIDFDGIKSKKELQSIFNEVKKNPYIVSLFISPSKGGFKGIVRIPKCNSLEHERYFKAFHKEFNYPYFDISNCNVDRVCFESYDPNIYINYDADCYNPQLIDYGYEVKNKIPLIPIDNEIDIIDKIMSFNWKKDFIEGERNSFIFDLAGAFCEYGISETTALGYIKNNIVHGDFSEREVNITVKSAYKLRSFNSKYFENYNKIDSIKNDLKKGKDNVLKKYGIDETTYDNIKEFSEATDFWFYDKKNNIKINSLNYKLFLEGNGFKKYYPEGSEKPSFVKVVSNKVEITSISKIKDFVLNYLASIGEIDVWNYCAGYQNLFSEQFLLMLDNIDLMLLRDKIDTCYLAFENGILEVKENSIELKEYMDIDGYIWKSHILKRDWKKVEIYENDYSKFVYNISNEEPLPIECCIGYLLCTYKNRSNNKAIILNDEIISQNPEGGTGKGLFIQGISKIRKTHIIDGKNHNDKATFQNQSVSLDDKVLVFDDVSKNFDFEKQFSLITEGITIRHLYKDPIKLSVKDSPKIVLSTNYAVKGSGNSHNRRRHEIEIAQYYGKDLTPEDDFGRQLFDEWNEKDYNKFDNYMVYCIQTYLKNGLLQQNAKNLKLRKFIAETSMEFYEWISEIANIPFYNRNDKKQYFYNFIEEYQDFKKWLTSRRFTIWIQKYCSYMNYEYKQGLSNGQQWFEIIDNNNIQEPNLKEINF